MTHYTEDLLIDYLHGELPDAEDARVHAHLATCDPCRALYDGQAALSDLLRSTAAASELAFPSMIKAHVWATIRAEQPSFFDRFRVIVRPAIAVPLAAAIALVALFGGPLIHSSVSNSPPGVAASYYLEEHAAEGQGNPLADHLPTVLRATNTSAVHTSPALIDAVDAATLNGNLVTND